MIPKTLIEEAIKKVRTSILSSGAPADCEEEPIDQMIKYNIRARR